MTDLISRQAAIDAIEEYADRLQMVNWKENPNVPYKVHSLNWCINTIRDLPSAQPQRKTGRWIDMDDHVLCSLCGATHYGVDKNYCSNCGADMREIEEHTMEEYMFGQDMGNPKDGSL